MSTAKINCITSVDVAVVQLGGLDVGKLSPTDNIKTNYWFQSRIPTSSRKPETVFFLISRVYEAYQDDPRRNVCFIHVYLPQHLHGQILNCDKTNCMKCPFTSARDWPLSAIQWISLSGGSLDSDFVSKYPGKSVYTLISTINFTETPFILLTKTSSFTSK